MRREERLGAWLRSISAAVIASSGMFGCQESQRFTTIRDVGWWSTLDLVLEESYGAKALATCEVVEGSLVAIGGQGARVDVWSFRRRGPAYRIAVPFGTAVALLRAGADNRLMVADEAGRIGVYNLWTQKAEKEIDVGYRIADSPVHVLTSMAISRDGRTVFTGHSSGVIRVVDVGGQRDTSWVAAHKAWVTSLVASRHKDVLVSAGMDNRIRWWNTSNGGIEALAEGQVESHILAMDQREDDGLVASGMEDGNLALWEPGQKVERARWRAHDAPLASVNFDPTGHLVLTGAANGEIRLWEVATGRLMSRICHCSGRTSDALFLRNGEGLIATCVDGTVRVWLRRESEKGFSGTSVADALSERDWDEIAQEEPGSGYAAIRRILASGDEGTRFIGEHLKGIELQGEGKVQRLVEDLGDDRYEVREAAMQKLEGMGVSVEKELKRALAEVTVLEIEWRLRRILAGIDRTRRPPILSGEMLRVDRSIAVLEWQGSSKAIEILRGLVATDSHPVVARMAGAALSRLRVGGKRRPVQKPSADPKPPGESSNVKPEEEKR